MSGSESILALRRLFPIALWAAGYADASTLEPFTADEILDGCKLHKIVGAARDRVTRALQSGSTAGLAHGCHLEQGLRDEQEAMLRGFDSKRRVLREVARCVADRGVRVLYLKGATRYLHSGRLVDFRSGDDLDVLVSDEHACQAALSRLGARTYRTTSDHEFANVEIEGVKVDFHRYYPAVAPTLRFGAAAVPQGNGFAFAQSAHRVSELRFDALDIESVAFPEMPDHVRFAAPAAAAMISATHAYRDFFARTSLSCRFKPLIRVGDLDEWHYFVHMAGEASVARYLSLYPDLGASHRWITATRARLSQAASGTPISTAAADEVPEAICRSLFGPVLTGLERGAAAYASQPTTSEVIAMLGAARARRLEAGGGLCDLRGSGMDGSTVLFGEPGEKREVRLEAINVTRSPDSGYALTIDTRVAVHDRETRLLLEWDSEAVEVAERAGDEDFQIKTSAGWSGKVGVELVRNGASRRCSVTLPPGGMSPATTIPVLVGLAGLGEQQQYRQGVLASFQIDI
ncbi:nucleotidyltransferase family protein [Paraburkholderia phenoliruptrix]|nr:nucleotidyltransferase family protein [Paraburkholderia phenoliruptrix]